MKKCACALAFVFASLAAAQPIADSVVEFSGTQGYRNWQYGYYDGPFNPTGFKLLPLFDGARWWRGTSYWTYLSNRSGHTNGVVTSGGRQAVENWAVRRWTAPFDARLRLTGHARKYNVGGGNGIVARIFVANQEVWNATLAYNDSVGKAFSIDRCVAAGQTIDFIIDPRNSNDQYDGSDFTAIISVAPPCSTDFTCDGEVNDADFVVFAAAYNILDCADPAMAAGCPADFNQDGAVDDADFVQFVTAYSLLDCP